MFPFWEDVIAPVIEAVHARRVVEIGALRGETTVRMMRRLGPECELHVIDPLPQFDPAEHERAFPGQYIFHLGVSHDVLPQLPPCDVALVDGDHNWFTVYHELKMLAATAREEGAPLPVLVLHDVAWPYGRRDLYYSPDRIPEEFRQPYRQAGMRPGVPGLFPRGGMNLGLDNAEQEGGERNGVMTALDDFMREHDQPLRRVVLPIYYGLAIVAEESRLSETPELAAQFDRWDSKEGQEELVAMAERIRLDEAIFTQAWVRNLQDEIKRSATRVLEITKSALADEHYIDNEVRIEYLLSLLGRGVGDPNALRDPARFLPVRFNRLVQLRAAGYSVDEGQTPAYFPYTEMGRAQLDGLESALGAVVEDQVPGDFAEIGVGRGGGAVLMRAFLAAHEIGERQVWVADEFLVTGPDPEALAAEGDPSAPAPIDRFGADLNQVRDAFNRFGVLDDRVRFLQGDPTVTISDAPIEQLALVRLGEGLGADVGRVLELVAPVLAPGAVVIVAGVADRAVERAVTDARERLGHSTPVERIDANAWTWRVEAPTPAVAATTDAPLGAGPVLARAPIAPGAPVDSIPLSVVVIFHNMRREAARTLHSLSRSYQVGVEDLDYEVIVIDNGSAPEERLDEELVASFGPQFRLVSVDDGALPSPTVALNAGIAIARGESLALMIDGAHVLTPGVLHFGMLAMSTYAPAVVATQQWYVGPGQQGDAQQSGYDQAVEDRLFDRIQWPADGYRLFEIGHFIGERDWFDGIVESNCLFVPRKLVEQLGGYDDSFSMPGGGYANLDLFERIGLTPGVNAASILGEGTFHQFHGGTTTNVADEAVRRDRVASYGAHFSELRGRPLIGLDRPTHYVGAMGTKAARRTRSRREIGMSFDALRDPAGAATDVTPLPVPDEVKLAAIEAMWDRQAWREATWLGRPVMRYPTDLHTYQELIAAVRPATILVVGDDAGLAGRARFMASVCDLIDHGRVIALGSGSDEAGDPHPRITWIDAKAESPEAAAQVLSAAGADPQALVFLGLGDVMRIIAAFEHYAPLVPVGGYVVIENTVVNGRPVASGFGPGPYEAAINILGRRHEFVADPTLERYTLTFNRNGYLRRMAPS
jgi:cephalosporin hydroxylase